MATYEDIRKANEEAKTSPIKDKPYIEVNERIKAFRKVYPEGFIENEMKYNDNGVCVFESKVGFYAEDGTKRILGTGTAYEKEGSTFINKTSYIENCETSSCGRALGMAGFGIDASVASFEEVSNAIKQQEAPSEKKPTGFPSRKKLIEIAESHYPEGEQRTATLLKNWNVEAIKDLSDDQLKAIYSKFGGK